MEKIPRRAPIVRTVIRKSSDDRWIIYRTTITQYRPHYCETLLVG